MTSKYPCSFFKSDRLMQEKIMQRVQTKQGHACDTISLMIIPAYSGYDAHETFAYVRAKQNETNYEDDTPHATKDY